MTEDTKSARPRVRMAAPTSAGGERPKHARSLRGLPFDPHDFPVDKSKEGLKEALAGIDEVSKLHQMQAFDTRITAAAYYERRIKELGQ